MSPPPAAPHVVLTTTGTTTRRRHHHGLSLFPPPSSDPRDPLRWSRSLKYAAFAAVALANFTANVCGAGPSVATMIFQQEFEVSAVRANDLLSLNFLFLGISQILWVPIAVKWGKRPAMIASMLLLFVAQIWAAKAGSFESLLAARCVIGLASGAGESIVPAIVSDIFFLHERATMMSIYVLLTSGGSAIGPLVAGYVVATKGTWRNFMWLGAGLSGLNLVLLVLLYPESNFKRPRVVDESVPSGSAQLQQHAIASTHATGDEGGSSLELDKPVHEHLETFVPDLAANEQGAAAEALSISVSNPSFKELLTTVKVDHQTSLWRIAFQPFIFLLSPTVIWAFCAYSVSLSAQIIMIYNLPSLMIPPPYLFTAGEVGLLQIAAIIGFFLATLAGGWLSDVITARQIRRAQGKLVAEQRLVSLIPFCWVAPLACLLSGYGASHGWPWYGIAITFGMLSFGTVFAPNICVTYVVDSFREYAAQALITINFFKNICAFIFLYEAVTWIEVWGFLTPYVFMMVALIIIYGSALPLYYYGEKLRGGRLLQNAIKRFGYRDM